MLYLINIHWTRRQPEAVRPSKGHSTYPENARTLAAAKNKAVRKFNRHLGRHLAIAHITEVQDPVGIFHDAPYPRVDCGSGQDYGICKVCGHGHGHILMQRGLQSASSH